MWWWGPRVRLSGLRVSGRGRGATPAAARRSAHGHFLAGLLCALVILAVAMGIGLALVHAWDKSLTRDWNPASHGVAPPGDSVGCAWHDRAGSSSVPDGGWAFVTVGGSGSAPVVEQFTCLHGSLLAAPGSPGGLTSWPSTPLPS